MCFKGRSPPLENDNTTFRLRALFIYMFRGEKPPLENDTTTPLRALSNSSLIGQLLSIRLIPNQTTATLSTHPRWATTVRKVLEFGSNK